MSSGGRRAGLMSLIGLAVVVLAVVGLEAIVATVLLRAHHDVWFCVSLVVAAYWLIVVLSLSRASPQSDGTHNSHAGFARIPDAGSRARRERRERMKRTGH